MKHKINFIIIIFEINYCCFKLRKQPFTKTFKILQMTLHVLECSSTEPERTLLDLKLCADFMRLSLLCSSYLIDVVCLSNMENIFIGHASLVSESDNDVVLYPRVFSRTN